MWTLPWMLFALLIAGSNSHFLWRLAPGLLLLALLASIVGVISFVIPARRLANQLPTTEPKAMRPQLITGQTVTTPQEIRRIMLVVIICTCSGIAYGWNWHANYTLSMRYHYVEVMVERHDPTHFTLTPVRMEGFNAVTCTPQNWQTGEKMKWLHFRWSPDCDDVGAAGDFEFYTKDGHRINFTVTAAHTQKEELANAR